MSSVNSMQALQEHLCTVPPAAGDLVQLIDYLLQMGEQLGDPPTRNFLLSEAQCWQSDYLDEQSRQFIAKRVFAFWRKGMLSLLIGNMTLYPRTIEKITAPAALALLDFNAVPTDILAQMPSPGEDGGALYCVSSVEPESELDIVTQDVEPDVVEDEAPQQDVNEPPLAVEQSLVPTPPKKIEIIGEPVKITAKPVKTSAATNSTVVSKPCLKQQPKTPSSKISSRRPVVKTEDLHEICQQALQNIENTLTSLQQAKILQIDIKEYRDMILPQLEKMSARHLPKIIKGIINRYLYTTQEKYPLMRIKDSIVRYARTLSTPAAILVFINYGSAVEQKLLKKFSQITGFNPFDNCISEYIHYHLEIEIEEHGKIFRRMVENCQNKEDLQRLFAQYPLHDKSLLKKYPALQIISRVKRVLENFRDDMEDITSLLNRELGHGEANIKRYLQKILVKNASFSKIQQDLNAVYDINSLFKHIQNLRKEPEMRKTADTLFQMVVTFLRGRQRVSFQLFKTSLNFLSPTLQSRVIMVVKKKLRRDLERKVQDVLSSRGRAQKRWAKLLKFLQNPQWFATDIKIFGYRLPDLLQKIQTIGTHQQPQQVMAKIFCDSKIPNSLQDLILEKLASENDDNKKTIRNCYRDLVDLNRACRCGEILSLRRPLTDLFQFYGKLNFADKNEENITGYQISREISKYYRQPGRTTFSLPQNVKTKLSKLVCNMVEEERERQMKKIQKEADSQSD